MSFHALRLTEVEKVLLRIADSEEPLTIKDAFEGSDIPGNSRRRIVQRLLGANILVEKYGEYMMAPGRDDIFPDPTEISRALWPSREGMQPLEVEEAHEEDTPPTRFESGADEQTQILYKIAEGVANLSQLFAHYYTTVQEQGGPAPAVDVNPFIQSFVGINQKMEALTKKFDIVSNKVSRICKELGVDEDGRTAETSGGTDSSVQKSDGGDTKKEGGT